MIVDVGKSSFSGMVFTVSGLMFDEHLSLVKSIANIEAILEKVLPIVLQYKKYCNINKPAIIRPMVDGRVLKKGKYS